MTSGESELTLPSSGENMLQQLDRLLRGELTHPEALRGGTLRVSVDRLALAVLLLGMIYGACMGCYALFDTHGTSLPQFLMTVGKVPLLFALTVIVTFPSLYVFNALVGSNLGLLATARLVAASLAVMLAILASLGPIVAFFSLSTTGYHFMLLLNVAVFTVAGLLGLRFLLSTLHHLIGQEEAAGPPPGAEPGAPHGALHDAGAELIPAPPALRHGATRSGAVSQVFFLWIGVFGLVGAQMAWVMRPFLGHPGGQFVLIGMRQSNFFEAILKTLGAALGG